jgi:hypothetical protein
MAGRKSVRLKYSEGRLKLLEAQTLKSEQTQCEALRMTPRIAAIGARISSHERHVTIFIQLNFGGFSYILATEFPEAPDVVAFIYIFNDATHIE